MSRTTRSTAASQHGQAVSNGLKGILEELEAKAPAPAQPTKQCLVTLAVLSRAGILKAWVPVLAEELEEYMTKKLSGPSDGSHTKAIKLPHLLRYLKLAHGHEHLAAALAAQISDAVGGMDVHHKLSLSLRHFAALATVSAKHDPNSKEEGWALTTPYMRQQAERYNVTCFDSVRGEKKNNRAVNDGRVCVLLPPIDGYAPLGVMLPAFRASDGPEGAGRCAADAKLLLSAIAVTDNLEAVGLQVHQPLSAYLTAGAMYAEDMLPRHRDLATPAQSSVLRNVYSTLAQKSSAATGLQVEASQGAHAAILLSRLLECLRASQVPPGGTQQVSGGGVGAAAPAAGGGSPPQAGTGGHGGARAAAAVSGLPQWTGGSGAGAAATAAGGGSPPQAGTGGHSGAGSAAAGSGLPQGTGGGGAGAAATAAGGGSPPQAGTGGHGGAGAAAAGGGSPQGAGGDGTGAAAAAAAGGGLPPQAGTGGHCGAGTAATVSGLPQGTGGGGAGAAATAAGGRSPPQAGTGGHSSGAGAAAAVSGLPQGAGGGGAGAAATAAGGRSPPQAGTGGHGGAGTAAAGSGSPQGAAGGGEPGAAATAAGSGSPPQAGNGGHGGAGAAAAGSGLHKGAGGGGAGAAATAAGGGSPPRAGTGGRADAAGSGSPQGAGGGGADGASTATGDGSPQQPCVGRASPAATAAGGGSRQHAYDGETGAAATAADCGSLWQASGRRAGTAASAISGALLQGAGSGGAGAAGGGLPQEGAGSGGGGAADGIAAAAGVSTSQGAADGGQRLDQLCKEVAAGLPDGGGQLRAAGDNVEQDRSLWLQPLHASRQASMPAMCTSYLQGASSVVGGPSSASGTIATIPPLRMPAAAGTACEPSRCKDDSLGDAVLMPPPPLPSSPGQLPPPLASSPGQPSLIMTGMKRANGGNGAPVTVPVGALVHGCNAKAAAAPAATVGAAGGSTSAARSEGGGGSGGAGGSSSDAEMASRGGVGSVYTAAAASGRVGGANSSVGIIPRARAGNAAAVVLPGEVASSIAGVATGVKASTASVALSAEHVAAPKWSARLGSNLPADACHTIHRIHQALGCNLPLDLLYWPRRLKPVGHGLIGAGSFSSAMEVEHDTLRLVVLLPNDPSSDASSIHQVARKVHNVCQAAARARGAAVEVPTIIFLVPGGRDNWVVLRDAQAIETAFADGSLQMAPVMYKQLEAGPGARQLLRLAGMSRAETFAFVGHGLVVMFIKLLAGGVFHPDFKLRNVLINREMVEMLINGMRCYSVLKVEACDTAEAMFIEAVATMLSRDLVNALKAQTSTCNPPEMYAGEKYIASVSAAAEQSDDASGRSGSSSTAGPSSVNIAAEQSNAVRQGGKCGITFFERVLVWRLCLALLCLVLFSDDPLQWVGRLPAPNNKPVLLRLALNLVPCRLPAVVVMLLASVCQLDPRQRPTSQDGLGRLLAWMADLSRRAVQQRLAVADRKVVENSLAVLAATATCTALRVKRRSEGIQRRLSVLAHTGMVIRLLIDLQPLLNVVLCDSSAHPEAAGLVQRTLRAFVHLSKQLRGQGESVLDDLLLQLKDSNGRNLLHNCIGAGNMSYVEAVLDTLEDTQQWAAVLTLLAGCDMAGNTPLHLGLLHDRIATVQRVLDRMLAVANTRGGVEGSSQLAELPAMCNEAGETLLHLATVFPVRPAEYLVQLHRRNPNSVHWGGTRTPPLTASSAASLSLREQLGLLEAYLGQLTPSSPPPAPQASSSSVLPLRESDFMPGTADEELRAKLITTLLTWPGIDKAALLAPTLAVGAMNGGNTPLHYLAAHGDVAGLRLVETHGGAAAQAALAFENQAGYTPAQLARSCNPLTTSAAGGRLLSLLRCEAQKHSNKLESGDVGGLINDFGDTFRTDCISGASIVADFQPLRDWLASAGVGSSISAGDSDKGLTDLVNALLGIRPPA